MSEIREEIAGDGIGEKDLDKKDITYDIIIDDLLEDEGRGSAGYDESSASAEPKGDHPAISILDMAIRQSGAYLKGRGLPPANNDVYENFSKPFLNEALWHYLPEGNLPDDPRIALALGVAGLGLAFAPTMIAIYQKQEEEEKRRIAEEQRKKKKREERKSGEETEREEEPAELGDNFPDWIERLEGGALSGI